MGLQMTEASLIFTVGPAPSFTDMIWAGLMMSPVPVTSMAMPKSGIMPNAAALAPLKPNSSCVVNTK